jgi:hypothetical protein
MSIPDAGQYNFKQSDGQPWTFMWQTVAGMPINKILLALRDRCIWSINSTYDWYNTLHVIGDRKMYSVTMPRGKSVDEVAAHWLEALTVEKRLGDYRGMLIVESSRPTDHGLLVFVCHAATWRKLRRMTVTIEARIWPEKPAPVWTLVNTMMDEFDESATRRERARDPVAALLCNALSKFAPWCLLDKESK